MNVPAQVGPADPAATQMIEADSPPAPRARVLVVDDDDHNLLAIRTVLEDLAEVEVASSGDEALRHLLKGDFAVILLDVYMPGMDGYETAQIIRGREQTKRIPIVFLSAVNKEKEHLMRGYSMGAVDYVFKPVEPVVLRSKVAVFVDLFLMTQEIQRKAAQEQRLLDANLRANAERLKVEQELRLAEQRQAAIIASLPIVLYLEADGPAPRVPQFVGGNFTAVTGFPFEAVEAQPTLWADRLHPEDRDRALGAIRDRQRTGAMAIEYRWQCADGHYKHFLDQAVLLPAAEGDAAQYAGTLLDVSDRKELENQLLEARKMDAIGKLTGGIAHDFNNLLAAVLGGLGLIERRLPLEEEHRKIIGMTRRAAEQGSELVKRLLAFARRQTLQPDAIDIGRLSATVTDLLAHTLGGLVQLEWRSEPKIWCAYADSTQLELALMNLIINARDAMPKGGTIAVSARNAPVGSSHTLGLPAGDYVVLAVADDGSGIPAEILEQVTEPFFTTKAVGKGTGLGLSMVYGFARQSDGKFLLDSEVGRGTTAQLWLPRAPAASESEAVPPKKEPARRSTKAPKLRILLVDDHHEVRGTTAAILQDLGHDVVQSASGFEALETLRHNDRDFQLMISDYAMPHLSGTEFLRAARDLCPGVPGLIVTGYAEEDTIGDRPAGVEVLLKPFSAATLEAAVLRSCEAPAVAR
jgi:signal transduction histidine kinase